MAGTILNDEAPKVLTSTSAKDAVSQMKDHCLLSRESLIKEQEKDEEIRQLALHAMDEQEAAMVPGCYFRKNGILMRKWRPPQHSSIT